VVGLLLRGPQGQVGPYFVLQNSWGEGWGDHGLGYIHHRDLAQLLRGGGEAAFPTFGVPR
jgi:C1A family cysteine protease